MTATAIATAPEPVGIKRLQPMKLKGVEFVSRNMNAYIERGTTLEEILHPEFWTHNAPRLREWGLIECRWEDKTRFAVLMVIETGQTWAKVRLLWDVELEAPAVDEVTDEAKELLGYKINFIPNQGFRVIHKEKGTILQSGISSKSEAELFLKRYIEDLKH